MIFIISCSDYQLAHLYLYYRICLWQSLVNSECFLCHSQCCKCLFLKLDLFSVPSCLGFNLFWAIFETSLKNGNCRFECRNFFIAYFFGVTYFTIMSKFVLFSVGLVSLLSCLGFKLFCVTARRGNSEPLLFSDPEPEDYGNVISSLSHHQPFSTLFAKCQPPPAQKSLTCMNANKQTIQSLRIL